MSNTPQGADSAVAIVDRRHCVRRQIPSLAYLDLGQNNGGIILNIGEGGLAVASAAPLYADVLATMRFQLPGSSDWLEASGKITRISESKKEAGLQFVDLSEDARNQIKGWVSSDVSSTEFHSEGVGGREKTWRRLEMPIMGVSQSISQSPNSNRATREHPQVSMPTLNAAATSVSRRTWVAASTPAGRTRTSWEGRGLRLGAESGDDPKPVLLKWRRWAALAVVVSLGAFLAGWFTGAPVVVSRILSRSGGTRSETRETTNGVGSTPATFVGNVSSSPTQNTRPRADDPTADSLSADRDLGSRPLNNAPTRASSDEAVAAGRVANVGSSSSRVAQSHLDVLAPDPENAAANVIGPRVRNAFPAGLGKVAAPTQEATVTTIPSPDRNQPEATRETGAADRESSPLSQSAENSAVIDASVSVSFGPYPSIRVPAGFKSQTSRQGASLQIGQLLSRVDPVYPEDAKAQRIEGIVKLHAVIGPDGTIESVEARSGPALLIPVAANAVRQWRYTPSSIGSQPVEAEEDITINFRLAGQATHPN